MDQYVIYNNTYHVLICHQCHFAIRQDRIIRHFRQLHKLIPLNTRQEIIEYGKLLDLWEPNNVQAIKELNPNKSPVQGLSTIIGLQCQYDGCNKLTRVESSMKHHCWVEHHWSKKDGNMWKKQSVQTFFEGQNCKYMTTISGLTLDCLQ